MAERYDYGEEQEGGSAMPRRDANKNRPTKDDIFFALEERRTRFSKLHNEMEIDQNWIYAAATHQSDLIKPYISGFPDGFSLKVLPLAELGVNIATDAVAIGETPSVQVMLPAGLHRDTTEQQRHEDELREWCEGFLYEVDTRSTESPWRDFFKKGFGLGVGIISYAILWDRWPEPPKHGKRNRKEKEAWARYEHDRKYAWPFDVKTVHPLTTFWDPDNDPPQDVIEEVEVNLRAMCRRYPHLLEQKPEWVQRLRPGAAESGSTSPVKRVTYISKDWYAVYVDQVPLLTEADGADEHGVAPNPMGYLWVKLAHSGFGEQDHLGRLEYRVKGIVRNARDVMASFITNFNVMEVMRQITAFPPVEFEGPDKDTAFQESDDFEYGPARKWAHSRDVKSKPFQVPNVPAIVFQDHEEVRKILEMLFGPDILRGVYKDDTAAGQATRLAQAKAPYRAMKVNAEQAVAAMLRDILCAIRDEFDGPVTVWTRAAGGKATSRTLDPKRIPATFQLTVDFSPPTDEEKARKMKEGMELAQAGWISERRAMAEYGDIAEPEEEMIQRDAERLMQTEPVVQLMAELLVEDVRAERGLQQPQPSQPQPMPQPAMAGMDAGAGMSMPPQGVPPTLPNVGPGGFLLPGEQPLPELPPDPSMNPLGAPMMGA